MELSPSDYEMIERNMAVTQNNTISNDSDLDDLDDLGAMDDDQDVPELTNAIKKHCIQLYFEGQGSLAVQVDETRFYERFSSYEPSQKPHRSLLNAMREKLFFKYAEAAVQAALKDITTLAHYKLDLVRAATLLSVWLQGESREAEFHPHVIRTPLPSAEEDDEHVSGTGL
ncbi:hypothetical protein I302_104659 [Kwoniella bestiolae CBS 10118]|uniref:Uncharacterized protein n=1 Tax=Kwoniella bestiolae CBS 10118 TaxID=1296100 RepID=A0A1B9GBW7_9TREE|nr:hypothetical protein I302_03369 [Kwoniella bestiolae CBS 10118]OCF28510.1 hypothetical protein I302_03369 [Kwoniella bestiolae CBS 10118]